MKSKKTTRVQVGCINVSEAKVELEKCPTIVKDYVAALERSLERWKDIANNAVRALKGKSKSNQ